MWWKLFHIVSILLINVFFVFWLIPPFALWTYDISDVCALICMIYANIHYICLLKELYSKKQ
jgi:hypothetical protein